MLSKTLYSSVKKVSSLRTYPHSTPTSVPTKASKQATAAPMPREVRVPAQVRAHRSWPMELVPNQNSESGARLMICTPVAGSLLMVLGSCCPGSSGWMKVKASTTAMTQRKNTATLFLKKARRVAPQ